jgi:hypothetical protein
MADPEAWLERLELPWPTFEPARYGTAETEAYAHAIDVLDAARVPFFLAGAFALNAYTGIWRSTKDLDFFLRPLDMEAAFAALERGGFRIEVLDPVWLSKAWRQHVFVDLIHANANGLMAVDETWAEHAGEGAVFGRRVRVAPAEEVILSKMFVASRERYDGADVLHLLFAAKGVLDWRRLVAKAGPHAGLLLSQLHLFQYAYPSFAHYVPREAIEAAERRAAEARLEDTFRGRLLDPVQFAVDVDVLGLPDERARVRSAARRSPDIAATRTRHEAAEREAKARPAAQARPAKPPAERPRAPAPREERRDVTP